MNGEMNQDEVREAIFDALYEYEVHKKKRRLKAVENAVRGTVMATVVGSAGFTLASNARENPGQELVVAMLSNPSPEKEAPQTRIFEGAVHFDSGQHVLTETKKNQLLTVINTISKDAVVTVMGHTDASGDNASNHKLGMLRAQAVAGFLSEHGIKVNGVGNQLAENSKMGWSEQRVDLIINVASATNTTEPASAPDTAPAPELKPQPDSAVVAKVETAPETKLQPEASFSSQITPAPEEKTPPQSVGFAQVETTPDTKLQPEATISPQATPAPEIQPHPEAAAMAQGETAPDAKLQPEATVSPQAAAEAESNSSQQPAARSRIAPLPAAISGLSKPAETEMPQQQVSVTESVSPTPVAKTAVQTQLIKGAVHFAFDKHVLTSEYQAKLLAVIKGLPQNAEISVIGRTDALGVRSYNEQLGINRAVTVANFLKQHGVKVVDISNQFADDNKMGWRERRVDLKVNEITPATTQALAQTLTSTPQPDTRAELTSKNGDAAAKQSLQVVGLVHFGFNKHALVRAHHERLLEFLRQIPKDAQLTVVGRTDSFGSDAYNKELGLLRARNVANYLSHLGINIKKVGSKVAKNRSTGWQARRVDVLVESGTAINPIQLAQPVEHKKTSKMH